MASQATVPLAGVGRRAQSGTVICKKRSPQLKVAYVTVQFPVPSETFATNEVRALSTCGLSITVHGLRPARPDVARLLLDRGVAGIDVTHNSSGASTRGAIAALRRPGLLLRTLAWSLRVHRRRPRDLLVSLMLVPRAFDILMEIERLEPSVVHMYWGHYPTLVGYLVQQSLPEVVTSLSIVAYDLNREYGGAIDVARRADIVRTHARVNVPHVAQFTGITPDRIAVIYNGVDVAWVESISNGFKKIPHRIVATGRLIPEKGMDDVLKSFAAVRSRWPDATLVVAGDGPDLGRLRALSDALHVTDAVEFLGHVAHARVVEEMAKAEVFVLLSRYVGERLPNVVKEGMACRCLCVTTPTPGIEELVESGVTGYVVPMSAPETVSEIVDAVFSGRVETATITARALDHVRSHFDLNHTAPRFEELWRAAVEDRIYGRVGSRAHSATTPTENRHV
jgi:colanic acid/amylovoran biosynthesis glycosyltransferase